MNNKRE